MAENSVLTSTTGRTSLADSSIFDSKVTEISKENLLIGSTSYVEEEMPQIETRVILVQEAGKQEELIKALKDIKVGFVKMESVEEFEGLDSPEFENVFVVTDFQDSVFNDLYKADCRVIGPPVVLNCSQKGEPLPFSCRPLYCTSMMNLVLCFTGFRKKEELVRLVTLVHHMGGVIRKDFNSKVTHLVANCTQGEKFRVAVSLGTPIMKPEWIYKAWERRNEQDFYAAVDDFRNEFKVPPFQDCILSFLGFSDEEKTNMEEMTEMQGGKYLPLGDERCTHLVVEENIVKDLPFEPSKKLYVVKQEWFWGSIQMDARAGETMYLYEKANTPELKKSVSMLSLNTPNSNRKRRRLKETLAQLSRETDVSPFPPHTPKSCTKSSKSSTPVPSKQSARWQVAKELYQTESNYVNILATIIQLFQVPLEEEGQRGGPILAPEEIKTIFGSIPDIFDVHTKIKDDLEDLIVNWDESKSIGDIFLKYSKDLVKTYPPFVNFFEMSKETIIKCEKQKPRFHAFLKINQAKPECGRQSLVELLIRPVQRLPSVALLLNDLKKHTADENPDKSTLEKAIGSLKEVMTHINEDKRKTEAQKQIFDVVYEVDGCPANLLSSHRSLVQRVETISLGEHPCDRGEQVTLFLFNDCLEIARKRHKVIGTFRSPHGQTRPPASLKHIHLMPLSQIKKVLDIRETEDCHNAFALLVRPPTEQANVLLSFQMTSDELPKENWLKMLCRHVANTICKADAENLIYTADPESFEVNTKDMDSTLSRASRAIKKTSKKVTRAFSFSKTPKRALRRALMTSHGSVEGRSPSSNDKHVMSRLSSTSSLAGIPSPSLVSLPSFFERRSHTLSRSTTHLI
ncbi:protein ECT2 isoform X11 [Homo sapiens]|uniref:protein ECT2 isoform g n=1 Tax=Homo sapiens TaxID=9606 RepID=UPI0007DC63D3|nr:protein ECT2 isoform g [Homo sapiens]NP_001336033.1 protein ECT2 isoform g [Homo sapiens]XP_047303592.1 protein ECT2 isoform X11 [Homo sapiens]XP_047303593.1 protein ECT2 isoform X11 [Homo sapiens]XP_047303594.1 protein ECT2 isoform X11 [Homo sapiens]XP_054201537.1 protein ECT2 isoform X11 [Homo sapiens]XP_054201538.1 protein ECT2 isoform X11 [Homo sapiens]XP_054201539.1 protein ECT2 isoform X11 [Homo sapiens]|eukprot:NP_001336032.1 protein ECT2 isoform g [Homo sapiens]